MPGIDKSIVRFSFSHFVKFLRVECWAAGKDGLVSDIFLCSSTTENTIHTINAIPSTHSSAV